MIWTTRPRSDLGGLAAITAGEGPLVLLLHGVGLRAEAWNAQIDALSARYRVVAPDLPGHGGSAPVGIERLGAYTDAVARLLDEPALVVGHSMGALIALDLAGRYPDLVDGLAALNSVFRRSDSARAAVRARAETLDGQSVADPTPTLRRWFGETQSPERAACEAWLRGIDPEGYRAAYNVFARSDGPSSASLRALAVPALFMTGEAEPNSTPAMSRAMADLAPQGQAVIVPGAAHMLPMTHTEVVNAALLDLAADCLP
ncbi:alpha/beta fold hydrolase [Seohaeicola nanhaiensis]|uniref:Alpha/beta fold hydrolase n=1 Tax=Seohaeicola nanhaiensis TaxID=1387282 RepID=A0ABV9KIZ4_9RHOB